MRNSLAARLRTHVGAWNAKEKIKFAFHIIFHPFDGFWDMKREKKGSLTVALTILCLVIVTNILNLQVTAFLFNADKFAPLDVIFEINKILLVFFLFCISNWSITTLMEGEGTFRDIMMMTGYACLPIVIIQLPVSVLSNLFTYSEQVYLTAANTISVIWFFVLLLIGIMTVHQYTIGKMLGTILVTLIAMAALMFLCLLFFNLFSQLVGFVFSVYKEMSLRL